MNLFRTLALAAVAAASALGSHVDRAPDTAAAKHGPDVVAERTQAKPQPFGVTCGVALPPCRSEAEPSVALRWPVIGTR